MMEITIDDNFFASPKSIILGNSGEVASRKIKINQPVIKGAEYYLARFSVPGAIHDTIFETEIFDGILTVPAIVLYEMGLGYIQWIARSISGQLIAKSDLIAYNVLRSIGDELSPIPAPEDTNTAIDRIKNAAQEALKSIQEVINSINDSEIVKEVKAARKSAFTDDTYESLNQRLLADFQKVQNSNQALDTLLPYIVVNIERGDNTEAKYYADDTLYVTGDGSIDERAFEHREDFGAAEINIGGDVGMGAFGGCTNLNMVTVDCKKICDRAFWGCPKLNSLTIGKSVSEIGSGIISNSAFVFDSGINIKYAGTIAEWNAVTKDENWVGEMVTVENGVVICSDGTVEV